MLNFPARLRIATVMARLLFFRAPANFLTLSPFLQEITVSQLFSKYFKMTIRALAFHCLVI